MSSRRVPPLPPAFDELPPRSWWRRAADGALALVGSGLCGAGFVELLSAAEGDVAPRTSAFLAYVGASHLVCGLVLVVAVVALAVAENRPRK